MFYCRYEATVQAALLELRPLTYNAARNGHQQTLAEAHAAIVKWIVERLGASEILVAGQSGNIFGDVIRRKTEAAPSDL